MAASDALTGTHHSSCNGLHVVLNTRVGFFDNVDVMTLLQQGGGEFVQGWQEGMNTHSPNHIHDRAQAGKLERPNRSHQTFIPEGGTRSGAQTRVAEIRTDMGFEETFAWEVTSDYQMVLISDERIRLSRLNTGML